MLAEESGQAGPVEDDGAAGLADSTGDSQEKPVVDSDAASGEGGMLMKRSDSVLDLHANLDYEQELDESLQLHSSQPKEEEDHDTVMPELSKWEMDEDGQINSSTGEDGQEGASPEDGSAGGDGDGLQLATGGKVTSEVLKRAENAIFTRAINAIRPIEIKKISGDRQKLYTGGSGSGNGSPTRLPLDVKHAQEHDELKRFQVSEWNGGGG